MSASKPEVEVVVLRCRSSRQAAGMRVEKQSPRQWIVTWAFPVQESGLGDGSSDTGRVDGAIDFMPEIPSCIHCGSKSYFECGDCHKLTCWNGVAQSVTCAWCNTTDRLSGWLDGVSARADG